MTMLKPIVQILFLWTGKMAKFPWNKVKYFIKNVILFFKFSEKFFKEKDQNNHLNDKKLLLKIAKISFQPKSKISPGMRLPNFTFCPYIACTGCIKKDTFIK